MRPAGDQHDDCSAKPIQPETQDCQQPVVKVMLNDAVFELTATECQQIPRLRQHMLPSDVVIGVKAAPSRTLHHDPPSQTRVDNAEAWEVNFLPGSVPTDVKQGQGQSNLTPREINGVITTLRFKRNAAVFESILDYIQTGQLHAPTHLCPKLFVRDLQFWGFDPKALDQCCYVRVAGFLQDQERVSEFFLKLNAMAATIPEDSVATSGMKRQMNALWRVMTDPTSSIAAKVYFAVLAVVILASFFVIAASTCSVFTRKLTRDEWKEYLGEVEFDRYKPHIDYFYDDKGQETATASFSSTTRYNPAMTVQWLTILGYSCTAFLALDYVIRLIVCPSLRPFCLNVINLCDAVAVLAALSKYVVDALLPEEKFADSSISDAIHSLQVLRVLRFVGLLSKIRGFRAVAFTLQSSLWQLLLIVGANGLLVMLFSTLLYHLGDRESMDSIPTAMWYSLVTITTVGYGDIVPNGLWGKLLGASCALCGILMLAMTLPIIANNFFLIYSSCSAMPSPQPPNTPQAPADVDEVQEAPPGHHKNKPQQAKNQ